MKVWSFMSNQTYTPQEEPPRRKSQSMKIWLPTLALLIIAVFLIYQSTKPPLPKNSDIPTLIPGSQNALEMLLYTQLPQLVTEIGHSNWSLDEIQFNSDNTQAMLWMAESDEDEDILAREPEMVLAIWDETTRMWQLHQMSDEDFISVFMGSDFKDSEIASRFFPDADPKASPTGVVYGGYKLPWKAGLTKRLTWSVAHGSCYPKYYCTYAFDFADGTMFEILASKGGYVYHWRDTCSNNDSGCTNSITIEDRTTNPWTYQIYLHLAKGSIPANLKVKGTPVAQGMKLGNADNTGNSTGHHLHFMVIEKTTLDSCRNYCFGRSVDITFSDVSINWHDGTRGGRPRLAYEAAWYGGVGQREYVSGNDPNAAIFRYYFFPVFKNEAVR